MASRRGHLSNVIVRWDPGVEAYFTACFGAPRLAAMSAALARPSLTPTLRTNSLRAQQEDVLRQLREKLSHSSPSPSVVPRAHPWLPATVVITGRGPCEVPYDESLPEVVINRLAAEAVLKGAHVYAPGLLAASPGIASGDLVAVSAALERPAGQWLGGGEEGTLDSTFPCVPTAVEGSDHDSEAAGAGSDQNPGCTSDESLSEGLPRSARRLVTGINRGCQVATDGSIRLAWANKPSQTKRRNCRTDRTEFHAQTGVRQLSRTSSQPLPECLPHAITHPPSSSGEGYRSIIGPDGLYEHSLRSLSLPSFGDGSDEHGRDSNISVGDPNLECNSTGGHGIDHHSMESTRGERTKGYNCGATAHGSDPSSAVRASNAVGRSGVSRRSERLFLGLARTEMGRRAMFRAQQGRALSMEQRLYDIPSCNGILPGQLMLQALPSILAAQVLNPAAGSRVLDMCAAPGGKTTALAALMGGRGRVVALDRTTAKVHEILSLAADMGASCVEAYKADATSVVRTEVQVGAENGRPALRATAAGMAAATAEAVTDVTTATDALPHPSLPYGNSNATSAAVGPPPYPPGCFDYVLLDPPCSALGLRPRLLHHWSLKQLRAMAAYQRALLYSAVQLLAPGGEMVYCTCTINPDENEANVAWALNKFDCQLELLPAEPLLGLPGLSGSDPLTGTPWLNEAAARLVQRFDPGELLPGRRMRGPQGPTLQGPTLAAGAPWEDGEDELADDVMGFFIARFRKSI